MKAAHTRVRPNDPDTSWFAAQSLNPGKVQELQHAIMGRLRAHGPMTYDELAGLLHHWSPSGVRTRTAELRELGWVTALTDADGKVVKRRAEGGKPSIVWRVCEDGERTGVDRSQVAAEPSDPTVDRFDIAQLRAAVSDALTMHEAALVAAAGRPQVGADAVLANNARAMYARLRELNRAVFVPSTHDQVTDAAIHGETLW